MATQTMLDTSSMPSPYVHSPSPGAIALPLLALAAIIVDAPCLIWHISNRNFPAGLLVGWVILKNAFAFANALIWPTDDIASWWDGQGYCDVVVKLDFAASTAIIASTFCIMRALALALDTNRPVMMDRSGRRIRHNILICLLCIALPIYEMIAAFVVQPARYYILGISGCAMAEWNSLALILLCYMPLMVLVLATVCYALLVIVRLRRYKRDLASVLASTESGLSKSRFMRLLGLSLILMFIYTPLFVYMVWSDIGDTLYPFSWSVVHEPAGFGRIILVQTYGVVRLESWTRVTIGFIVFACFGFGKDIRKTYRGCLERLGLTRCFPNLCLDERDPRNTRRQRRLNSSQPSEYSSSGSGSQPKVRTKKWISKFSSSSSSSTRPDSVQETWATVSTKNGSPVKPSFTPTTPTNRPSGLLEQDLFESGDITFDVTDTVPIHSSVPSETSQHVSREHTRTTAPEAAPARHGWFSRFCEAYVQSMSQRPRELFSPNLQRHHRPTPLKPAASVRSLVQSEPGGVVVTGAGATVASDYKKMKHKAYEQYVLDRLA